MATKTRGKSTPKLAVRRVTSKKERAQGGFFTRLKTDEWMKGHAIFTPDPEAAKNPGYYEYFEHYDKPNNQYVPCAGDDCYMCEMGDNPSGRALTLWYFPENPEKEKFKVLKLNGFMIRDFGEIEEEEGGVLGRYFRVKRLSDDGKYRVSVSSDRKKLTASELKALLKEVDEITALDFEQLVMKQLLAAIKKVEGIESLSDDDDDDDEDEDEKPTRARRGKPASSKKKDEEEDEDDDEDEDEDDEDENDDEDEDSDDEDEDDDSDDEDEEDDDEDEDEDDEDDDEDEDEEEDDDEEDEDEEDEDDDPVNFKNVAVVSTNESEETITLKVDGKNVKTWVGEGLEVDFDKVKKGVTVSVEGVRDDEGDPVLTSLKIARASSASKTTGKTTRSRK